MGNCFSSSSEEHGSIDRFSLEQLVQVLRTGPLGHRVLAAQRCTTLTAGDQDASRAALLALDALTPLTKMLQELTPVCQVAACQALCNLALDTDTATEQAFLLRLPDIAPQLRALLLCVSSPEGPLCACQALANLAQSRALTLQLLHHIGPLPPVARRVAVAAAAASAAAVRKSHAGGLPRSATAAAAAAAYPAVEAKAGPPAAMGGRSEASGFGGGAMGGSAAASSSLLNGMHNSMAGAAREHLSQFLLNCSLHSGSVAALEQSDALGALLVLLQDTQAPASTQEKVLCALYNLLRDSRRACTHFMAAPAAPAEEAPATTAAAALAAPTSVHEEDEEEQEADDRAGQPPAPPMAPPLVPSVVPPTAGADLLERLLRTPASTNCQFLTACVLRCAVAPDAPAAGASTTPRVAGQLTGQPTAGECVRLVGALQALLLAAPARWATGPIPAGAPRLFTFGSPHQLLEATLASWHTVLNALRTLQLQAELANAALLPAVSPLPPLQQQQQLQPRPGASAAVRLSAVRLSAVHLSMQLASASPSAPPSAPGSPARNGASTTTAAAAPPSGTVPPVVPPAPVLEPAAAERLVQLLDVEQMEAGLLTALLQLLQLLCADPRALLQLHAAGLTHRLTHLLRRQPDNADAAKALRNVAAAAAATPSPTTTPVKPQKGGAAAPPLAPSAGLASAPVMLDFVTAVTASLRHSTSAEVRKQGLAALISLTRAQPRAACNAVVQGLGCEAVGGLLQKGLSDGSEAGQQLAAWSAALLCQLYISDIPCQARIDGVMRAVMARQAGPPRGNGGSAAGPSSSGTAEGSFSSSVAATAAAVAKGPLAAPNGAARPAAIREGDSGGGRGPPPLFMQEGQRPSSAPGEEHAGAAERLPPFAHDTPVAASTAHVVRVTARSSLSDKSWQPKAFVVLASAAAALPPLRSASSSPRDDAEDDDGAQDSGLDEDGDMQLGSPASSSSSTERHTREAAAVVSAARHARTPPPPQPSALLLGSDSCGSPSPPPAQARGRTESYPGLCCSPAQEGDDAQWGLADSPPGPAARAAASAAAAAARPPPVWEEEPTSPEGPYMAARRPRAAGGQPAGAVVPPRASWAPPPVAGGTALAGPDPKGAAGGTQVAAVVRDGGAGTARRRGSDAPPAGSDAGGGGGTTRRGGADGDSNAGGGGGEGGADAGEDEEDGDRASDRVMNFLSGLVMNCDIRYLGVDQHSVEVV